MNIEGIRQLAEKVNCYWQNEKPNLGNCAWERSCYMLGNVAAYELTQKKEFLDFAEQWANSNGWGFFDDVENGMDYGNDLLCGHIYFQLMDRIGNVGTDQNMLPIMQKSLVDTASNYWWWIDAIYMALPFFNLMGVRYNDRRYFDKAYKVYQNARDQRRLYDTENHLWYRDEKYLPDVRRETNGEKIFWGRGNGWVFAGIARALDTMGKENQYYHLYAKDFCDMAESLRQVQNADGSYSVSFLDKETYPYHESSSTVLITLGFYIGLRLGLLTEEYRETAEKGFRWLTDVAMNQEGRIGYAQDIAGWPSHKVSENLSKDYVVGTYLLILKELARYDQ